MAIRIYGRVKIICWDSRTGKVQWVHRQNNVITDFLRTSVLSITSNASLTSARISISTQTTTPDPATANVTGIIGTTYKPGSVTSPRWFPDAVPPYGEIQGRIDNTGTSRTFDTIALTSLSSANEQASLSTNAFAYLKLSSTCTQGVSDILDLTYQVQFKNDNGDGMNSVALKDFGGRLFALGDGFAIQYLSCSPFDAYTNGSTYSALLSSVASGSNDLLIESGSTGSGSAAWDTSTTVNSHFKQSYSKTFTLDHHVGKIINTVFQGANIPSGNPFEAIPYSASALVSSSVSPIQNNFPHGTSATGPFFDSLTPAVGSGTVALSGSWTGTWPELYEFDITATGAIGVSTYKFKRRTFLGFTGNNFTDVNITNPFRNSRLIPKAGFHGWRQENNDLLIYSDTQVVQYDTTGVTLLDLTNGASQSWDSSTTPALNVTNVRQCAVDKTNSRIYVACRDTGLWRINVSDNTIVQEIGSACFGVDVGRNNRVYAIFSDKLSNSDNFAVGLAFTFNGITNSLWDRVWYLKVDPENANDRIAIVYTTSGSARGICWWDQATGTSSTGPAILNLPAYPAGLDVSDSGSFWVLFDAGSSAYRQLTYGSASFSNLNNVTPSQVTITHSVYGSGRFSKVSFWNNAVVGRSTLVAAGDTTLTTWTTIGNYPCVMHLYKGIAIFSDGFMRCLATDNSYIWEEYGWNGSAWVLGNVNSRATHSSAQSLGVSGLSVTFTEGVGTPKFSSGDFYTQAVCRGILKENSRSIFYASGWYTMPTQLNVPIPSTTIPASAPYTLVLPHAPTGATPDAKWITAETDTPQTLSVEIDGTLVTTVNVDASTPAPGEITLNGTTGVMTFNSADAGKSLSNGTYVYVRRP